LLWHVAWCGAFGTVGGCSDVGARCNVPLRNRPAIRWLGHMPPSVDVPTYGDVPMYGHLATCPYGIIRNVAAGRRCIFGGCGMMVGAFATGGRRCTVGGRCIVVARRVVRHWAPFGDVALLWHVAWWGDMPPSAGVPMWGHVATCPYDNPIDFRRDSDRRCVGTFEGCGVMTDERVDE